MHTLSLGQELRLRDLVRRSPVLTDVEFELRRDCVAIDGDPGIEMGLETLARTVAGEPVDDWPGIVDDYLTRTLERAAEPRELDQPLTRIADRIFPWLLPPGHEALRTMGYATELAPGVLQGLVLDKPDSVAFLTDTEVERHGLDRLQLLAFENLRRHGVSVEVREHQGTHVVSGDDYTSACLLALPAVVTSVLGDVDLSNGVVVAVPTQATLVFHVLTEDSDLERVVYQVSVQAKHLHTGVHPISQRAYVWHDGALSTPDTVTAELVRASTVLANREFRIDGDRIVVGGTHDHYLLRLRAVADAVADAVGGELQESVDTHLRLALLLAADPPAFAEPTEVVLASAYPQLVRPEVRPDPSWWTYARDTVPGLLDVLALDRMPDSVSTFHDEHVARHGHDAARAAALCNLRAVEPEQHTEDDGVHTLLGGPHIAATALILDEIVARTTGETELPDGVVVTLPMRQWLSYHVPRGPELADALLAMFAAVTAFRREHPLDVLSPHVFWWRDGTFHPLTGLDGVGEPDWLFPPEFGALYQRLCPPPAEILDRVLPVLADRDDLAPVRYADVIAPGLRVVFACDGDVLSDADVAGMGLAAVRDAAWRNFRAMGHDMRVDERDGTFTVRGKGNVAAGLLSRPLPVGLIIEADEPADGVLVAVPDQNTVLVRTSGAAALRDQLGADTLSRLVYRWRDGVLRPGDDDLFPVPRPGDATGSAAAARPLAPGRHAVLARAGQDLDAADVAGYGAALAWELAVHNALAEAEHTEYDGDGVHELTGPNAAGLAAALPETVALVSGETELPHGVLVALSGAELLRYHVPTGSGVREAAEALRDGLPEDAVCLWWLAGAATPLPESRMPAAGGPLPTLVIDVAEGDRAVSADEIAAASVGWPSAIDGSGLDARQLENGYHLVRAADVGAILRTLPTVVMEHTGEQDPPTDVLLAVVDRTSLVFRLVAAETRLSNADCAGIGTLAWGLASRIAVWPDPAPRVYRWRNWRFQPLANVRTEISDRSAD